MKDHPVLQIPIYRTELDTKDIDVDANFKRSDIDIAF